MMVLPFDLPPNVTGLILVAFLSSIVAFIVDIFGVVLSVLGRPIIVLESDKIRTLDRLFVEHGWCNATTASTVPKPASGWVFMFPKVWLACVIFGSRKTIISDRSGAFTTYELFIFGFKSDLMNLIRGDPRRIQETVVTITSPYRTSSDTSTIRVPRVVQSWQQKVLDVVLENYKNGQDAPREFGCSLLVWGPSFAGKSTLPELVAAAIRGRKFTSDRPRVQRRTWATLLSPWTVVSGLQVHQPSDACEEVQIGDPVTVKINISRPGATLELAGITDASSASPSILCFDEFDIIAEGAKQPVPSREGNSMADSKQDLNNTLDKCGKTDHLCVIATMNADPNTLDPTFTRKGRFDFWVKVFRSSDSGYDCEIVPAPTPKTE